MERIFDLVFSCLALLLFFPLLLPIVVILKFSGEGEIFYLQERIGRKNKIFKLYKFATMLKDSPNIGTGTITMKDDPRVLPIGKFLRKTKINELPQLINIIFGEMSVIGPRPLTIETFISYSHKTQKAIVQVKPGLSGLGSIIFRGEEDLMNGSNASVDFYNEVIAPYKGKLEEWFVINKNLYIYFISIFITVWVILVPKTRAAWLIFSDLPEPPEELKIVLNYKKK